MTTREAAALSEIKGMAADGRVAWKAHALRRLVLRRYTQADVIAALLVATECRAQRSRYLVPGTTSDGRDMIIVVQLLSDVLIVTVMPSLDGAAGSR